MVFSIAILIDFTNFDKIKKPHNIVVVRLFDFMFL